MTVPFAARAGFPSAIPAFTRSALCALSLAALFALSPAPLSAQTTPSPSSAQANPQTKPQPQTVAQKIAASQSLLDINTATPAQLRALPGMGDAYVQRVIAARPYTAKNQLTTRGILPQSEYEAIKNQIIAHRPKP